ncbi:MAG: OmpH family outer membrane protein [Planctomycetota bacterium]|nr:OmpH family outer membrane protein [Planctomycetota bacterium]
MNSKIALSVSVVLAIVLSLGAGVVQAQQASSNVAICNVMKALKQTKEFKDMQIAMQTDNKGFNDQLSQRKAKIGQMQTELQILKQDSPEFAAKNKDLLDYSIESDAWAGIMQREEARKEKQQTKGLFDKMDATIAKLAQSKGITLIVSDQHPELSAAEIEKADPNQLSAMLVTRTVLYNDPKLDITQDLVNAMDQDYMGKH